MIHGIGTDIIQIARVQGVLQRNGERFAEKILGPEELENYHRRRQKVEARGLRFLATRFAAKEAFSKALGLGMRMPMTWRAMQTLNDPAGRPVAVCSGALKEYMDLHQLSAQVSLTDEADYAVAFVIVEKTEKTEKTE
jgi:holo-[acyl-carrier protein] synthase